MQPKEHWENVYATRPLHEASWYQPAPERSLAFFRELNLSATASIIDVGGGDSLLADHLLEAGFSDITVLDISEAAIGRARKRLGAKADKINWIVCDITALSIDKSFDCWHDRAAFHFLVSEEQVEKYIKAAVRHIFDNGKMIIGTFSTNGPEKCSGLPVKQYSEDSLTRLLQQQFDKIRCITEDHITPAKTVQNFLFCSFTKHIHPASNKQPN